MSHFPCSTSDQNVVSSSCCLLAVCGQCRDSQYDDSARASTTVVDVGCGNIESKNSIATSDEESNKRRKHIAIIDCCGVYADRLARRRSNRSTFLRVLFAVAARATAPAPPRTTSRRLIRQKNSHSTTRRTWSCCWCWC
jgi:hypothetical protein